MKPQKYVVCAETIGDKDFYTVRAPHDCSPVRFTVIKAFSSFDEADDYIKVLRNKNDVSRA